ncbi:MAG: S1C family serine protease [Pseudonocardia sp.]
MRTTVQAMALALALATATGCAAGGPAAAPPSPAVAPPAAAPAPPTAVQAPPGGPSTSYADLVERLEPSVVTVRTDGGQGSGVVFRPDVVVTNQHVVGDTRQVVIGYADGTESPGTVLATDRVTDIAVVRTERTGLPVPTYRTELPRPGDPVLALGSPLGFEGTVTAGIVSGLGREVPGSARRTQALIDLIQTDAAISPGNSGGALIDAGGQVVGINEAYIPPGAGAVSIGFAIPAATAVDIAEQLLADGTATHPYLGVSLNQLTPSIRQALGVRADAGALVLRAEPGGPAAAAGVRDGDVITMFAGQPVRTVEDVLAALRGAQPGQAVPITVERGGDPVELTVTVGTRPAP